MRTLSRGSQSANHADMNYARAVSYDETRGRGRARVKGKICLVPQPILQRPLALHHPRAWKSPRLFNGGAEYLARAKVSARRCWVQIIVFAVPPSRRSEHRKVHALRTLPRFWTHPRELLLLRGYAETTYVRHTYYEKEKKRNEGRNSANTDALLARVKCNCLLLPRKRKSKREKAREK